MSTPHHSSASDALPVRPVADSEFAEFCRTFGEALLFPSPEEEVESLRAYVDLDRTLAAFDGDRVVGTAMLLSFEATLPGGVRPVAGVSAVGVLPTHRRRGVLTALMRRQLHDVHERGEEAVATLFASEGGIYGRFGYGLGSMLGTVTVHRGEGVLRADAPRDPALRTRMVTPAEAREEAARVHETARLDRVGEFRRNGWWWNRVLRSPGGQDGFGPAKCVVVENDSGAAGYALYRTRQGFDAFGNADSALEVVEVHAVRPAALVRLWEFLLNRDLVGSVTARLRPADDPLLYLLADRHRARWTPNTGFWGRLVDVPRALSERSYAAPVDVVVEVTDAVCPWNRGLWRLHADGDSAHCERTDRPADLSLDVEVLSSAYLGGEPLTGYAAAGLVRQSRPEAVLALSAALTTPTLPHCSVIF
ncbi:GNAT family N-acetyltransferase [Thermobifida halotolerans]|uniref:GNAT family N-acetyltransferase n=1 Tax=Thermobifida halotolerans TaxID=483545 RepID=A0A399G4A0_9ACTN|nr:GNAT family N-acetyltransferase [Thermobifida halotolerans]UOE17915.1 GNAT family N-acetyltransferase [Thermobifida halotolerans]